MDITKWEWVPLVEFRTFENNVWMCLFVLFSHDTMKDSTYCIESRETLSETDNENAAPLFKLEEAMAHDSVSHLSCLHPKLGFGTKIHNITHTNACIHT
mgnify:CR=1 FL=1